ncbi:hypothetical protein Vi05172_g10345 [Venturia inaequalis]|nr:hypothetical protein Vi05172_g10345 [Venturia inaequalis]
MGNGQSAVENRSPGRGAKPKGIPAEGNSEGTSSASGYDTPCPLPIGVPYSQYNDSETVVASPTKRTVELNQEFRQHMRSQLLSPEEHDSAMQTGRDKVDVLAVSLARSLSRSRSRRAYGPTLQTSSSKLNNNASQMSLPSERAVDLGTAVALLQELRKTATPEDLVALHRALLPTRSNDPLSNPADGLEDRLGMSASGLIRKKSLARPGVATRHARKELKPEAKQENGQLWKSEMMGTSPLARLARVDDLDSNLQLPPSISQDRAHTPTGDEYSNLGSLKRGSLMVMNGAVSPSPSFLSREFLGRRPSEDEYFTASENASASGSPVKALPSLPINSAQYPLDSSGHSLEDFRFSDLQERSTALLTKRSGSPLKREIRAESPIRNSDRETTLMTSKPRTRPSAISLIANSENHSLFSNVSSVEDLRIHQPHQRIVSQSAISLAAEYMMELPPSPHKPTSEGKETLPVDSPPNSSVSRAGLAREESYSSLQYAQQHESWESTQVPLFGQSQVGDQILARTALRSHPPNITVPLKSALKSTRASQAKTDSGYCSSVSTGVEACQVFEMDPLNLSTVDSVAASTPKGDVALISTVKTEKSIFKPAKTRPKSDISERWPTFQKTDGDDGQETPGDSEPPKTERRKSWKKSIRRSLSRSRTTETTPEKNSPASIPGSSLSLEATKPKKLQKKRPLSQSPLTIRDSHNAKGDVPPVPSSTFSKFLDRVVTSPGLEHLDRTYEDTTRIIDTRRGSASPTPASEALPDLQASYFPDAQQDDVTTTASCTLKQATPDQAAPKPPVHRHGFSRMRLGRASTSEREEEEIGSDGIAGVTDFGTVAKSLGSGPYDIAKGNQPQQPRSAVAGPIQYPHQLGADQGQYRPREGWDAETASRFAQMRSRQRAAATADAERESTLSRKPAISNRPRSYHEDSPVHYSQQPNNHRRPKSVHGSVPQGQGHVQQLGQAQDHHYAQQEYLRPPALVTTTSALRPRTVNDHPVAHDEGTAHQEVHRPSAVFTTRRPKTANTEPAVYNRGPRSGSPVKTMVGLLDARAALAPTPSPTLPQSPTVDWSEQSRLWKERKRNAQEGTRPPSSEYSESVTSTTTSTMATYVTESRSQPGHPTVHTSYSSTPVTTTRTVYSPLVPTTTTHTTYPSTPVSGGTSNNHTSSTVSFTTSSRIPQTPTYSRTSTPSQPTSRDQLRVRPQSQYEASPTPARISSPAQQSQTQSNRMSSSSIFGRFGGGYTGDKVGIGRPSGSGGKRDVTARTQAIRSGYGVDFGDIPVRHAPT